MDPLDHMFGLRPPATLPASPLRAAIGCGPAWQTAGLRHLVDMVGGVDALEALHGEAFIDEPFDDRELPDEGRDVVSAVLERLEAGVVASPDPALDELLDTISAERGRPRPAWIDVEMVTISRRLLRRIADHRPAVLARLPPDRAAATVVWLAMAANGRLGRHEPLSADRLWIMFGVPSCRKHGWEFLDAAGLPRVDPDPSSGRRPRPWLADARLLDSRVRRRLVVTRDAHVALYLETIARRNEARPVHPLGDGKLELRGRKITPRWARVGLHGGSRATIALMVGESEDDAEVLMLTVPDARALIAMLTDAVHAPLPTQGTRPR